MRSAKAKVTIVLVAILAIGAIFSASASAFGQCGGSVSTGSQLLHSWQVMGVTSQASEIARSAGFHSEDGSLSSWMKERVVKANLASAASPEDFGCHPGTVFSVHHRTLGKGTPVMVALPLKMSKGDVRTSPHKGFHPQAFWANAVGKSTCSNPLKGKVRVILFVRNHKKHHPKSAIAKECVAGKVIASSGNCNTQSNTSSETCGNGQVQSATGCITIQINNVCGEVAVGGSTGGGEQCKFEIHEERKEEKPPPPPPPSITITSMTTLNMIPEGKTSGPFIVTVNSSEAGGSLTVDPGIGGVSNCESSTPKSSLTFSSLTAGNSELCLILYAPSDAAKPSTMTATFSAILGSAKDVKTDTFEIQYPERP